MRFALAITPVFLIMAAVTFGIETFAADSSLAAIRCLPQLEATSTMATIYNGLSSMWFMYLLMAGAHAMPWVRLARRSLRSGSAETAWPVRQHGAPKTDRPLA